MEHIPPKKEQEHPSLHLIGNQIVLYLDNKTMTQDTREIGTNSHVAWKPWN